MHAELILLISGVWEHCLESNGGMDTHLFADDTQFYNHCPVDHRSTPACAERCCTSHPATGPSVTHCCSCSWAPLATGEVPHPVQNGSVHALVTAQQCPSYVADLVAFCLSDSQRWSLHSTLTRAAFIHRTLISHDVHSPFAVCSFGTVSHRRYAPWPRILHFVECWKLIFITLHF